MTNSIAPARKRRRIRWAEYGALLLILAAATALRLHGVGFGLPSLNDPDEPLFMMTALEMLRNHSLNPGWFGHPGTTTLYCLALVSLAVGGIGIATGRFADGPALVAAVYADPGILFLPGRLFIVACAVLCVWFTWSLGKKLGGVRLGLIAAAFLAVNAVHIHYSQIIRTDVQATVFMLLCTRSAVAIAREGRTRDYLLAGLWAGLACATKWPAAIIVLNPLCAGLYRVSLDRGEWRRVALLPVAALASLIIASPYLLLDYPAVMRNLAGEARTSHPGATGGGFLANLGWYAGHPLLTSLGVGGLVLSVAGTLGALVRPRIAAAILPGCLAFLIVIGAQALLWERWIVPLLPFAALAAAAALCWLADRLRARTGRPLRFVEAGVALLLMLPMLQAARTGAVERSQDTRQVAAAWVAAHVAPGSSIVMEHAGFDLLRGPWRFLFPLGSAGCLDARGILSGKIRYSKVERLRSGRAVVDLAHVDSAQLSSCHADYAILSHYDGYRDDPAHFPEELGRYAQLLRGGTQIAIFRPEHGVRTGPVVRIVRLKPRAGRDVHFGDRFTRSMKDMIRLLPSPFGAAPMAFAPMAFALVASCWSTACFAQSAPAGTDPATTEAQPAPPSSGDTRRLTDAQRDEILNGNTVERAAAVRGELPDSEGPGRGIHGEVGVMIGTNGTRGAYGVADIPLGDNARATVAVESSTFDYRRR